MIRAVIANYFSNDPKMRYIRGAAIVNEETTTRIREHLSRNEALIRLIQNKGASINEPRRIDCHFWAPTETCALGLSTELRKRGFAELRLNQSHNVWNLEMAVEQSASQTAGEEFTAEMTTTAASFGAVYDGWGTDL